MLTKGWDTISIVRQDSVNSDLAASWNSLDHEFSYTSDEGYACHGVFDCWSIINGGGGRLLRLRMPIRSGFSRPVAPAARWPARLPSSRSPCRCCHKATARCS